MTLDDENIKLAFRLCKGQGAFPRFVQFVEKNRWYELKHYIYFEQYLGLNREFVMTFLFNKLGLERIFDYGFRDSCMWIDAWIDEMNYPKKIAHTKKAFLVILHQKISGEPVPIWYKQKVHAKELKQYLLKTKSNQLCKQH